MARKQRTILSNRVRGRRGEVGRSSAVGGERRYRKARCKVKDVKAFTRRKEVKIKDWVRESEMDQESKLL